ncbi:MAG TPA: hypothetical protein VMT94_04170 [Burkholderiales bacterium]|nr:hypothetical protein [Burkholderiales bacterium]
MKTNLRNLSNGVLLSLLLAFCLYFGWMVWLKHSLHGLFFFDWTRTTDTRIVRFKIASHNFGIPRNYLFDRHSREGGEIEGVIVEVLFPEMQPYDNKTEDEFKRLGHGRKINLLIENSPHHLSVSAGYKAALEGSRLGEHGSVESDVPGLTRLPDLNPKGREVYVSLVDGQASYFAICDKEKAGFSPGCHAFLHYSDEIYVNYFFGRDFLPEWKSIDTKIKELVGSFEKMANAQSAPVDKM